MDFKKTLIFLIVLIALFGGVYLAFFPRTNQEDTSPTAQEIPETPFTEENEETETPSTVETKNTEIPKEFLLDVPFTPQAPTANWDELHNEACEEASVLMANAFFSGDTRETLPPSEVEKEIDKLTKWQQEKLGYYLSIDAEETVRMIEEVYGLKAEVVREFSEDSIKAAVADKKLVLAPVNGRALGNPYFRQPGPIYHMFVIKGYTEKEFIVNEPGTKRGKDYRYTYQTIRGAIGDYDHDKKETDPRKPAIIIVSK